MLLFGSFAFGQNYDLSFSNLRIESKPEIVSIKDENVKALAAINTEFSNLLRDGREIKLNRIKSSDNTEILLFATRMDDNNLLAVAFNRASSDYYYLDLNKESNIKVY